MEIPPTEILDRIFTTDTTEILTEILGRIFIKIISEKDARSQKLGIFI
jgi:hypothetical protein